MTVKTLAHFRADPTFGNGVYRRRLRFTAGPGIIRAQVADTHHAYWLVLGHADRRIATIDAGFQRAPTTVCSGATPGLQALIGQPIDGPAGDHLRRLPAVANCTHLRDLALWAMIHAERSAVWDIEIPDQRDAPVWISIARDGAIQHRWRMTDRTIIAPADLAGKPLMQGFARWAETVFTDEALIAATMLQRGIFVARGREHIIDQAPPVPLAQATSMEGMCWAYSGERFATAHGTLGYVRDFTDGVAMDDPPVPGAPHDKEFER